MKTFIYSLLAVCTFMFVLPLKAQEADKTIITRTVDADHFSAISVSVVGEVHFTPAKECSVKIEGPAFYVEKLSVEVSNHKLIIKARSEHHQGTKINNVKIYVSAPTLEKITLDGVGGFACEETLTAGNFSFSMDGVGSMYLADLKCDNARLSMDGVGSINVHLNCKKHLTVTNDGVGEVTISGYAGSASISNDGIGRINRKGLKVGGND